MRARVWTVPLACAVACLSVSATAPAEHNVIDGKALANEAASAVGVVDPWADAGGAKIELASSEFLLEETLDPWRARRPASTWTRVRSGLDSGRPLPVNRASRAALPQVRSGLDISSSSESSSPASWIHPDIIDPWASHSR